MNLKLGTLTLHNSSNITKNGEHIFFGYVAGRGGGRYLFKICFKNLFKTDIFEYIRIYKNKFDESPSPNFLEFKIIEKLIFKEFNSTLTIVVG